jgi:hypothetical protein
VIAQWYSAGLRPGTSGVPVPTGFRNFSLHHRVQTCSGAHSASYPEDLSLGVKRPGREADHSPPSKPRSRMRGAIPPLSLYGFMARCSVDKACKYEMDRCVG